MGGAVGLRPFSCWLAYGIDDRKVVPYRPQDAKSISREVTFQRDVRDYELLKEVLLLLAFCVEHRAGHLEQIYQSDTLHKTVEYMRLALQF